MLGLFELASLLRQNTGADYKNVATQIREISTLLLRGHVHPSEYYKYALSERGVTMSSIARYLGNHTYWTEVQPELSDRRWKPLLENKWFFQLHFRNVAPLPRMFGLYHREYGFTTDGRPLASKEGIRQIVDEHQLAGLVAKPVRGWKGENVMVIDQIKNDEGGAFVARDGTHMTLSELGERLDRKKDGEAVQWIVQEHLAQDEQKNAIAPYGSHTLRAITVVDGDGTVHVPSVLKAGGGLLDGAFLRALESHGIELDAPDLPPIRPMKALKMLGVT